MKHAFLCFLTLLLLLLLSACGENEQKQTPESLRNDSLAALDSNLVLVYNVLNDAETDDYEIYVMNMDGTGKKNISNHPGVDWAYTSAGDKVYFVSDRDTTHRTFFLYEMDADGNQVRKLTDFTVSDSWQGHRKGGKEHVVRPHAGISDGFFIIDDDGNILDSLMTDSLYKNDPVFSPDGKQIVFRMTKGPWDELWSINDDGSGLRRLTHYPAHDRSIKKHGYHAGPPQWNPAGDYLTFQSKQDGKYSIFAVTPDGRQQWQLMEHELNEGYHAWSPGGGWLAFEMFESDWSRFDIWLKNMATGVELRLTDSTFAVEQAPVFLRKP